MVKRSGERELQGLQWVLVLACFVLLARSVRPQLEIASFFAGIPPFDTSPTTWKDTGESSLISGKKMKQIFVRIDSISSFKITVRFAGRAFAG